MDVDHTSNKRENGPLSNISGEIFDYFRAKNLWIEFAVLSYDKACQVGAPAVENVKAIFLFTRQCNACLIVIGILSCCLLIISCA